VKRIGPADMKVAIRSGTAASVFSGGAFRNPWVAPRVFQGARARSRREPGGGARRRSRHCALRPSVLDYPQIARGVVPRRVQREAASWPRSRSGRSP
jgi:hypothetical protein